MRNIIILGTGRSGTSMVAATFRSSGAFMGDHLLPATPSNPHGYYEDRELNRLNNDLIRRLFGRPLLGWRIRGKFFRTVYTVPGAFFMAAPRVLRTIQLTANEIDRIRAFTRREPFCYKDPRFSVTLPLWMPHLPSNVGFVVVFRDPMRTTESMIRDAREQYEPPLPVTQTWGFTCWWRTYSRLIVLSKSSPHWMFINYDAMLDRSANADLSEFASATLDFSQIDDRTSRSQKHEWPTSSIGQRCSDLYEELCTRASTNKPSCLRAS